MNFSHIYQGWREVFCYFVTSETEVPREVIFLLKMYQRKNKVSHALSVSVSCFYATWPAQNARQAFHLDFRTSTKLSFAVGFFHNTATWSTWYNHSYFSTKEVHFLIFEKSIGTEGGLCQSCYTIDLLCRFAFIPSVKKVLQSCKIVCVFSILINNFGKYMKILQDGKICRALGE